MAGLTVIVTVCLMKTQNCILS